MSNVLPFVRPGADTPAVIHVDSLLLDLATGTAVIAPAADGPECPTHHAGHVAGYVARQTRRGGAPIEQRTMFPGSGSRDAALTMVEAICGQAGGWAVLDTVFTCGHWI